MSEARFACRTVALQSDHFHLEADAEMEAAHSWSARCLGRRPREVSPNAGARLPPAAKRIDRHDQSRRASNQPVSSVAI